MTHQVSLAFLLALAAWAAWAQPAALAGEPPCPIAYAHKENILFLDGKGNPPRQLGHGRQPTLAPGSRRVVWVENGQDPKKAALTLFDLASGSATTLATPGGYINNPRISPNGKTVCYVRSAQAGSRELWLMALEPGAKPVRLAQAGKAAGDDFFEPMWTPDGAHISYQDMTYVYLMRPDGVVAAKTPLTAMGGGSKKMFSSADRFAVRPGAEGQMVFSMAVPGSKLFRKKVPDVSSALFLYDPASQNVTRLTQENMTAFAPAWSPDGRAIIYSGYVDTLAATPYPFRVYALTPGGAPVEIGPGEDPMTAPAP